jgi:hypothetical protein
MILLVFIMQQNLFLESNLCSVKTFTKNQLNMNKTGLNFICVFSLLLIYQSGLSQSPRLRSTSAFALFTSVGTFTNKGITKIYGNVGTNSGAYKGDSLTIIGNIHVANAASLQASKDLDSVYSEVTSLTCDSLISGAALGNNRVLGPNIVYCISKSVTLTGNLYLDAKNDPGSVFIIKIEGALSTSTKSNVIMLNGGSPCNVFWQINGAFSLGKMATFKGTLLVNGAINLLKGAFLDGRALTKSAAIELDNHLMVGCKINGAPLPFIALMSFSAKPIGVNVQLNWATATEINNDYFTLERSKNGSTFEEVAILKGAGNSSVILNYSVIDLKSYIGTSFYRLKETDYNGKYLYSDIISTKSGRDFTHNVFPDPFEQKLNIYLDDQPLLNETEIVFHNVSGKEIVRVPLKQSSTQIDNLGTAPGIYLYHILNNSQIIQSGRLVSQQ